MYRVTKTPSGIYAVDLGVDISNLDEDGLNDINILITDGEPVLLVSSINEAEEFFDSEVILLD